MVKRKESNHKFLWVILEVVFVIAIVVMGTFGYIYLLRQMDLSVLEDNALIKKSFVGGTLGSVAVAYNVEWFFSYLLRTLFLFIGNHVEAAITLQFVMQILAAFIIYRGMRRILGRVISGILFGVQVGVYLYLLPKTLINPCWMILLFCALIFYFLTLIFAKCGKRKENKNIESEMETNNMETAVEVKVVEESELIIEEKPVIKFLDNPLPGPKKHVSKTLDYDLKDEDLANVSMEYDIEVSEEDDFDL